MPTTRRHFCASAIAAMAAAGLPAQTSRIDVAAVERIRILAEANTLLKASPQPPGAQPTPEAIFGANRAIAALTAAFVLTTDPRYALHAGKHLYAWFVDPATCMSPTMPGITTPAAVTTLAPLAEIARALPFLADTAALYPPDHATAYAWFRTFLTWLDEARPAFIAREAKDHSASTHLLLSASIGRLLADEPTLAAARARFKKPTLRNQISANGEFAHEVATPYPWRNTLLNFDLLACACDLLSTPYSSLWTYELEDGPSLRTVAAFLYPILKQPERWPYLADADHFRDVPRRRLALLLAGRAYNRPEYVDLWRTLPDSTKPLHLSEPIRQPLLWTTRPPHNA